MTREEAVSLLRRYRREEIYTPTPKLFGWTLNYEFMKAVYGRYLVLELIHRINQTDNDPIKVVRSFYYQMDDMVCESEHRQTWTFASTMENCAADILRYLKREEKNEHAKN